MWAVKIAGSVAAIVALIVVIARHGFPETDPMKFMDKHSGRRLTLEQHTTFANLHLSGKAVLKDELAHFSGYRDPYGMRNILCAQYGGIDHPNHQSCCPATCGTFCGTEDCQKGPGGHRDCCEGSLENFCSLDVHAPCLVNTKKLSHAYSDALCKEFNGIDHPRGAGCCSPLCGEFCGGEQCAAGPGGESSCCGAQFETPCGRLNDAPCVLPPMKLSYPGSEKAVVATKAVHLTPVVIGGTPATFSVMPKLPTGLWLDSFGGVISGHFSAKFEGGGEQYIITARNPAGEAEATITFLMAPKTITYPDAGAKLRAGTEVKLLPKVTGGLGTKWRIAPPLPDGLFMDPSTGVIAGTPSKTATGSHVFTVREENSEGKATTKLTLDIVAGLPPPGSFSYEPMDFYSPGGKVKLTAVKSGAAASAFTVAPALLSGLILDPKTGKISGTLTKAESEGKHEYTVTATNAAGKKDTKFTLNVLGKPGKFSYPSHAPFQPGSAIDVKPSGASKDVKGFTVTPALVDGLRMDEKTGEIKGKLKDDQAIGGFEYEITAEDEAGSTVAHWKLAVMIPPAKFSYPKKGPYGPVSNVKISPDITGEKVNPTVFDIAPALPDGMMLGHATGVISGMIAPDQKVGEFKYVVTATNPAGKSKSDFTLYVGSDKFTYPEQGIIHNGDKVSIKPDLGGDLTPTSYSIKPALFDGLKLDEKTGEIQGEVQNDQKAGAFDYVIAAKTDISEIHADLSIEVADMQQHKPTKFSYPVHAPFARGAKVSLIPTVSGSTSYSSQPPLDEELDGLKLDRKTGEIRGTLKKDQFQSDFEFLVTGKNAGGQEVATVAISVLDPPGKISYPGSAFTTCGETSLSPRSTGGKVDKYTVSPPFPKELQSGHRAFSELGIIAGEVTANHNGVIEGLKESAKDKAIHQYYTVTARNRAGTSVTKISLSFSAPTTCPSFPWWILLVIALIAGAIYWYMYIRKEEEKSYTPVSQDPKPAPKAEPKAEPVQVQSGLPLTFDTGSGKKTVFALRKPLGLLFDKVKPIVIAKEKEGHGKDIGIRPGWTLTAINNVDIENMEFNEQDRLLHESVSKLPGAIPLKFKTPTGEEQTLWATQKPLGLIFEHNVLPIMITSEKSGHGKDIGVKVNMQLIGVNGIDVQTMNSYAEVDQILRTEVGKLPRGD